MMLIISSHSFVRCSTEMWFPVRHSQDAAKRQPRRAAMHPPHIVAKPLPNPVYDPKIPKSWIQGGTQSRVRSHDGRPRCRRPYAGARAHSLMVCPRLAMQTRPSDRRSISQILICLASPKVLRRDPRMVWRFDLLSSPSARDSIIIVISLERHRGER